MKTQKALTIITIAICIFAAAATIAGIWPDSAGEPFTFTSIHGQNVEMQGLGLYRNDSVSTASQAIAQDVVTLLLGIPILLLSTILALRSSLRGRLIQSGTLAYFLYTYAAMSFMSAYNPLFLVYVALFSLSLFGFAVSVIRFDVPSFPAAFSKSFPRLPIAVFIILISAFLLVFQGGRVVMALLQNTIPDVLETYTTLVISAMDLGLIVPASCLAGILLLRKEPWGYLLSAILCMKGISMTTAVTAMVIRALLTGLGASVVEIILFPGLTVIGLTLAGLMIRSISDAPGRAAVS